MNSGENKQKNILTVLVEDYFHVGAFENLIQQGQWSRFEPRYEQNTRQALDLLDQCGTKATFFILGWIAEQNPGLVREIANRGHEVASRGFYHRSLRQMSPEEFREDLRRTRNALEKASGTSVYGYRAAEKLNFKNDLWTLEILAAEGFAYDASFLPKSAKNDVLNRHAKQIQAGENLIWEIPYSTAKFADYLLPIAGGNYFRQIPYTLLRRFVKNWHSTANAPFVMYFHVWELDTEQPRINAASRYNRVRHYRNLDKMRWILEENLKLYNFTSVRNFLGLEIQSSKFKVQSSKFKVQSSPLEIRNPNSETQNRLVTIIVPCFNEEPTLPYLANTLRSLEIKLKKSYDLQFIFIDDKSRDQTFDKLTEIFGAWENVRIIQHTENKGVAAGIMTGLKNAETEIVCSMDCDCTYDPHELEKMIPLLTEDISLVTASPYHPAGGVRNVPEWRLFLSKGASFLYRRVLRSKLHTFTSCFRVYRRSAFENLAIEENGFLGVAEMLGKIDISGGKIIEHPAVLEVRLFGFSKMKTLRTVFGHLRLLSRLAKSRWRNNGKSLTDGKNKTEIQRTF